MINSYRVVSKSFADLTNKELYAILQLRVQVFCVEQDCPYQDLDGQDQQAEHFYIKENQTILAYARIVKGKEHMYHIGRMVVNPDFRKKGLATIIMQASINTLKGKQGKIEISAQSYLSNFYQGLGFKNTGKYYLEDDIPHEEMYITLV